MKHGIQIKIAKKVGISAGHLSDIINNKKRPSWSTAKRLAKTTETWPELWLEGDSQSIRTALSDNEIHPKNSKKSIFRDFLKKWGLYGS